MNLLRRRRVPCLAFVTTIVTLALGGCTALEQFPAVSANYKTDLTAQDPNYADALDLIKAAAANPDEQERIRNEEIDRRLRVIDLNFTKFETGLAQENVQVGFLVSVVEVGVGVTGALVSETVSQILSATSGGLAGSQAAYAKAALFNKALSALLAQMIAGRKAILATIYEGRTRSIAEYPLSAAVRDLEAYYFAGSLPGAIVGTSADATVKNEEAQKKLDALFIPAKAISKEVRKRRADAATYVWDLDEQKKFENLRNLAKELGIPEKALGALEDENARDRILDKITVAFTAEDMDEIERAIEKNKAQ